MKINTIRNSAIVLILGALSINPALADSLSIHIGSQPPPPNHYEKQWQQPAQSAVWIAGHNEWHGQNHTWVPGYYTYPAKRHERYVEPRYQHQSDGYYYNPGHWTN